MSYWRLSTVYLFYFGSLGALMPYWSLYLHSLGFDAQAIGELTAIVAVSRIVAPSLWAWLADHTGRHIELVRFNTGLGALCFAAVPIHQDYWWLAIVMGLFGFFWSAALPQLETVTFAHLGNQSYRYTHIRLWGSLGFIITVMLFGWLFQYVHISLLPHLALGLFVNIWLASLLVPRGSISPSITITESFGQILKQPAVIALLVACFLMQVSHGPYYTFYTIYLEQHGYSRNVIGQFWALGVLAEIGIFGSLHHLLKRFTLGNLLGLSLTLSAIRWLLIGYGVEWWPILLLAQLLHAASFGMYHGVAIQLIRQHFIAPHQGRGQALYVSLGFGAGGAVGSLISGYTWESLGPEISYLLAAITCMIAVLITKRWIITASRN